MIVFDLDCAQCGARCESWFASSADYDTQRDAGQLSCPHCGSDALAKAPMAPAVPRKGSQAPFERLAAAQAELLKDSRWVGGDFAATARAMHAGEQAAEVVHGQASLGEARDLLADGIPVCPLPLPVVPPSQVN